jgi:hypothetical protein
VHTFVKKTGNILKISVAKLGNYRVIKSNFHMKKRSCGLVLDHISTQDTNTELIRIVELGHMINENGSNTFESEVEEEPVKA